MVQHVLPSDSVPCSVHSVFLFIMSVYRRSCLFGITISWHPDSDVDPPCRWRWCKIKTTTEFGGRRKTDSESERRGGIATFVQNLTQSSTGRLDYTP